MDTQYHETAGGVVVNAAGQVLVLEREVERNGARVHEVRLPKGHIDRGETPEAAAVREVAEESGYAQVEIVADLGTARSAFTHKGRHHLRDERYFLMRLTDDVRGAPAPAGAEEALFVPRWLAPPEAEAAMTYDSERDFVRRARTALAG